MQTTYKQFCPVAMAAEILCKRWSVLVLRELIVGSKRFSDLRRGLPRMSPTLLSQRLKEFETAGILTHRETAKDGAEYRLTPSGEDLRSVVQAIGIWGQRWIDADVMLDNLDPNLLMWDMRRNLNTNPMPERRSTIAFEYTDLPKSQKCWWLIVDPECEVDLCSVDPGFEVDLNVTTRLGRMTAIWLGQSTVRKELTSGNLIIEGDRTLARNIQIWLGLSAFATEPKRV